METISLPAHFDGERIQLDKPYNVPHNARLVVTILSENAALDTEREDWYALSRQRLAEAYGDDEPEYTVAHIKEFNPLYERR